MYCNLHFGEVYYVYSDQPLPNKTWDPSILARLSVRFLLRTGHQKSTQIFWFKIFLPEARWRVLYRKLDVQNLEVDVLNISNQTELDGIGNWFLQERWTLGHCLRLKQQLPQPLDARAIILWQAHGGQEHGLEPWFAIAAVSASNSLQNQWELLKKQTDNGQSPRFTSCNPDPRLWRRILLVRWCFFLPLDFFYHT